MKKVITILAISVFTAFAMFAKTWTVSKNPDIPGQFTEISEAIESGSLLAGDTLLVAGAEGRYVDFTITQPMVIIGSGINNPYGYNTRVEDIYIYTDDGFSPSGAFLSGLRIEGVLYFDASQAGGGGHMIEDVIVERCWIQYTLDFRDGNSNFKNITIRNCVLKNYDIGFVNASSYENIMITNNLFDNRRISMNAGADLSSVTLLNNVFINESSEIFAGVENIVVQNNIFQEANPQGCTSCTFNSNTSYGSSNNVLPGGNNLGDTQNNDGNPLFVNYTTSDAAFTFSNGYDFHLQAGSPCLGTGIGPTDRGMYGNPSPVELGINPAFPQMTDISFTDNASSVKEEGTLNVKFKAKKQD